MTEDIPKSADPPQDPDQLAASIDEVLATSFTTGLTGLESDHRRVLLDERLARERVLSSRAYEVLRTLKRGGAPDRRDWLRRWGRLEERLNGSGALRQMLERVDNGNADEILRLYDSAVSLLEPRETTAFVMSIDIRRSTELMLKANTPKDFSQFITTLADRLTEVIKENNGVADKFTGDGLLSFFPPELVRAPRAKKSIADLVSSDNDPDPVRTGAGVLRAANACHAAFDEVYEEYTTSFGAISLEVGLGIGIDYGPILTTQISGTPTIIGRAVVYACRLSSGPRGSTWLNVGAWKVLKETVSLLPISPEIKHEGLVRAWSAPRPGKGDPDEGGE